MTRRGRAGRPRFLTVLTRGFLRRCPRCGARGLFEGWFELKPNCPSCGLETERGEGFWLGGMAINLGITEAIFGVFLVASIAATLPDPPWTLLLIAGLAINVIVPVVFYPVAKSVFLGIDMLMFRMDPMRDQPAGPYEGPGNGRVFRMGWTRIAAGGDVEEGDVRAFFAGERRLAVARSDGTLYAFDDECTHRQCSLSDGDVEGVSLMCPCHGGEYDLSTGAVIGGPPPEPIRLYPVEEADGEIRVDLSDA